MRGYYETDQCPVDQFGKRSGGGPLPYAVVHVERDSVESFCPGQPYSGRIYDHALTSDQVEREYETRRITVNKTTHRIRFENETESSVDVVIEAKDATKALQVP